MHRKNAKKNKKWGASSTIIVLLTLILVTPLAGLKARPVREYNEISYLAMSVLERFPPSEYHYLGVGRSPSFLMAFFEELGLKVSHLPISGFENAVERAGESPMSNLQEPLDQKDLSSFKDHFTRFFPTPAESRGKKILVIDYQNYGRSLIAVTDHLYEFSRELYPEAKIEALGLSYVSGLYIPETKFLVHQIMLSEHMGSALALEHFKDFSKYPQFRIQYSEMNEPLVERPEYEAFKAKLRETLQGKEKERLLKQIERIGKSETTVMCDSLKGLFSRFRLSTGH